ncbi:hypothetical protein [Aureibacter tunicatorum]|uniref:Phosphate-selective porin O and P n=1 Tax=Aureibacter tunicatorum TaxID=866807 RepID=A0AAE3XRL2_9BACT|nr:hypothetical protein [Aureibacter tunicatorum]MDR6240169.1 hypothetical protein [Aureibacter tunicatorum]BDD05950.1 hypothetical protein AUTU_34330 [Aureibacter tunicatorum]
MKNLLAAILCLLPSLFAFAQEELNHDEKEKKSAISELKYIKQAGFANASSKVFTADQKLSISGFGEINYVNYQSPIQNKESKEIEQYYTNLYRFGTYIGYRFSDKIIFMSEIQLEYLQDGFFKGKDHFEYNIEASLDFLFHDLFNLRVGNYPLNLGWVNVNEEPIGFYSVNRPEVERTIIPSQWLEQGILIYGSPLENTEYQFGVTKGLDARNFTSGTWIRDGRYTSWTEIPPSVAFNGKLSYGHEDNTLLSLAGYYGDASRGYKMQNGDLLKTNLGLMTIVGAHNIGNFTFFGLYSRGWLSGTDQLFDLGNEASDPELRTYEVLGSKTQGYYLEGRYNIMPLINPNKDWKLPIFIRYERLNTHLAIDDKVQDRIDNMGDQMDRVRADYKDLEIITVGVNFRPKKNWTYKANYQFRSNKYEGAMEEPNQFELGLGFIF